jgi:hypothetical protein
MDNFIYYLDNYKKKKDMRYWDLINIFNLSNLDYNNNFYSNYEQSTWNKSYIPNYNYEYLVQDQQLPTNDFEQHIHSYNYYQQLYPHSTWNTSYIPNDEYEYEQSMFEFERQCNLYKQNDYNTSSNYDMWQKKNSVNDLQISLENVINITNNKKSIEPIVIPEPIPTIIKQNKVIDVVVNTIDDLIKLIDDNPYNVEYNYNINLEALHNIRPELIELNNMIGMSLLKTSVLNQLIYYIQELNIGSKNCDYKHTVISGPPGTGKTEIAKIIGRMYAKVGILKKNIFKKVTRNDLIAGYLGQTALKTKDVINECMGGCLFIDEAYSLASSNDTDLFSKECIDTLCEALSDNKDNIMVIIAGYENELNETFFRVNQGLESRFIWRFKIDHYNSKEMMQIFKNKVKENEWEFENENSVSLKWFETKKNEFKNYGRDMELLFSHIKVCHARRIYGKDISYRKKISTDDIDKGFQVFLENKKKQNVILSTMYL